MKNDKIVQFVLQLIKLTKTKELLWEVSVPQIYELPSGEIVLDKLYKTTLNDKTFRIYRYKYKSYLNEKEWDWNQRIRLELIDSFEIPEYEFEYNNSMNDLYEIVREQTSNIINVVDEILGLTLEIHSAKYYTPKQSKDITDKVKEKVLNNRLVLVANNEIDGDPEHNVPKKLKVTYSFAGETKEKEVNEGETIVLP